MKEFLAFFLLICFMAFDFAVQNIKRTYYNIKFSERIVNAFLQRDLDGVKYEAKMFLAQFLN